MEDYFLEKDGECRPFWSDMRSKEDRDYVLDIQEQNGDKPVLFCNCSGQMLPLKLTHEANGHRPKIINAERANGIKHNTECAHYCDGTNNPKYVEAVKTDNEGNIHAFVSFGREEDIPAERRDAPHFRTNDRVYNFHYMTPASFFEWANTEDFLHVQMRRDSTRDKCLGSAIAFSSSIHGFANHKVLMRGKPIAEQENALGRLFYSVVSSYTKKTYSIGLELKAEIKDGNVYTHKISVSCEQWKEAVDRFSKVNNGMSLDTALKKNAVMAAGFYKKAKAKTGHEYDKCFRGLTFILVSPKYGLFSESQHEALFYDKLCDLLFRPELNQHYGFYKPLCPEGIYKDHPDYVPDGIIRDMYSGRKYAIEVFGRNEPDYLERKAIKIRTCNYKLFYWDVLHNPDPEPTLNQIRQALGI
jgi:hypothetical protein